MKNHKLSIEELESLWIASFRYYLGRMTISTHSYCDSIVRNWPAIPERAKIVILRELQEEIKRDDRDRENRKDCKALGHDCDSQKWREVFSKIEGDLK